LDVVLQGTGPADWPAFAHALVPWVDDGTLLIASSDFTHYGPRFGYVPFREDVPGNLRTLDLGAVDAALTMDPSAWTAYREKTGITACGHEPIGALLTLLNRLQEAKQGLEGGFSGRLLDYYRSGDLNGDYESTVSYAAVLFQVSEETAGGDVLDRDEQAFLLTTARRAIDRAVGGDPVPGPEIPRHLSSDRLERKRAAFVTLRAGNSLRGCIGSIFPREPLVRAVVRHAVQAAFEDNRFPPVGRDEVKDIHIEISVLTVPKEIAGPEEIVLGRDGVLLERDGRRAVFLPQVASENGWDLETTLRHLATKAGLAAESWKGPGATLRTFQAEIFAE
jgi:AmmeMemoRadiSam system protein A